MRILFISDLHGASLIVRKAITAVSRYNVDALFLAGDLTGKDLRPIIDKGNGIYFLNLRGDKQEVTKSKLADIEMDLENYGHYYFYCTLSEVEKLINNEKEISTITNRKIIERIEKWGSLLSNTLDLTKIKVIITPGNDDMLELDDSLKKLNSLGIETNYEGRIDLGVNQVITLDYSNPTPWETPREVEEKYLWNKIESKINCLNNLQTSIFNFHVPPYNTRIDLAPELDKNLRPVVHPGSDGKVHVGSKSVRRAIEKYQPILGFHGHIHESPGEEKIGRTICLNPGSEYQLGLLNGYIIDLNDKGEIDRFFRIEG